MTETSELLAALVSFPTESRSPNADLIDLYADRAAKAGGVIDVVAGPTGRANLHIRFGPDVAGGIVLSGHTDVVPAGSGWATNPYEVTMIDGQLRGRGTADMKGFLAAVLVTMESVDVSKLRAPIHLALSYDEEIGCVGVRGLLNKLVADGRCQPEIVVVGEPTQMDVCTAHAGKVAYRIAATAQAGHSSKSRANPTAIGAVVDVASAVQALNEVPEDVSSNIGTITGGIALNVLSPFAGMDFEVRHAAAVDIEAALESVWMSRTEAGDRLSDVGGGIETEELVRYPACATDPTDDAVLSVCEAAGRQPAGNVDYGCEAGLYVERLGSPAVIIGPGNIADAHMPDEFVYPEELEACGGVVRALVTSFGQMS